MKVRCHFFVADLCLVFVNIKVKNKKMNISIKLKAAIFLILYFLIEYFSDNLYKTLGPYSQYCFEIIFIFASLFFVGNFIKKEIKNTKKPLKVIGITFIYGLIIRVIAGQTNLIIPFDIQNYETIAFLLVLGPIIEEALYRGTLIECVKTFNKTPIINISISGALFSYAHFRVIGEIPEEIKTFVQYQGFYTLTLGLLCAWIRLKHGFNWSVLAHILFNFGFYLASI